jgi:hypothetical protein
MITYRLQPSRRLAALHPLVIEAVETVERVGVGAVAFDFVFIH